MLTPRIPGRQFFVTEALRPGATITLSKELHHRLTKVLRLGEGAEIFLCDSLTGRYRATLHGKTAQVGELHTPLATSPNNVSLWLGLPKRDAWESALRQATELGVAAIQPILTRHSVPTKLNEERAHTLVTEAAEQCERLTLPLVPPLAKLEHLLEDFDGTVYWADETAAGAPSSLPQTSKNIAVLVGPEGGFSPDEIARLKASPKVISLSLGPTILRTDTAVVAALARVL
jgi:16S rRNA (uracil1498-N3)-methyltransferase